MADTKEQLAGIAWAQRLVIYSVLLNLSAILLGILIGTENKLPAIIILCGWGLGLYGATTLANRLSGVGTAVVVAIGVCIPIVSLLVLLVLFSRATKRLRDGGIEVGFLGADQSQFS